MKSKLRIDYKGIDEKRYFSILNLSADQGLWTIKQLIERQKNKDHVLKVLRTRKITTSQAKQMINDTKQEVKSGARN